MGMANDWLPGTIASRLLLDRGSYMTNVFQMASKMVGYALGRRLVHIRRIRCLYNHYLHQHPFGASDAVKCSGRTSRNIIETSFREKLSPCSTYKQYHTPQLPLDIFLIHVVAIFNLAPHSRLPSNL